MPDTDIQQAQDRPVLLHPLVYLADGDEVTIGRRDTDSYGIFPADGAEIVRRLETGDTPREVARWYEEEYGEAADIDDVLAALDELGLIRHSDDAPVGDAFVRWQRLGQALFSPPAWFAYAAIVGWALVISARSPDLVPNYRHIFFSDYFTVIELGLFATAIPLILWHETFHALAARRLGLRSRLRISRRLYYMVVETALDGLVTVPRRQRYLPILAGMLADLLAMSVLIIAADLTRAPDGAFTVVGRLCLASAFATLLRLVWQFLFYLRTDLYVLITTVLGCVDLHTTAKRMLRNRAAAALRQLWPTRRVRLADESLWHPVDRRVARWYTWLIVIGYTVSIATFVLALIPVIYQMFSGVLHRLAGGSTTPVSQLVDAALFLAMNLLQVALTVWLARRERRRATQFQHVIA